MINVAGQTLFDRTLDLARTVNPARIVSNLHYKAEMLASHLSGSDVQVIVEAPDILDTGGGLRNALPLLGPYPVMTTNTDAIWVGPNPFEVLLDAWAPEKMDALLVCIPLENCIGRAGTGDFDLKDTGRLERGKTHVYGGVQILKTDLLSEVPEPAFSMNKIWDQMDASGRLFGVKYPGRWCDIGTPEGIQLAEDLLRQHADD